MKVLHIISGGETGGSRKHVTTLLEQFPAESVCLAVFQEGALSKEARDKGIRVELFSQNSRYDIRVLSRLAKFINDEQFEIVHSHGPRANLFMSFIKSKIKAVWVTTIHSDPKLDFMKGGLKGKIFTKLNMGALKKIDYFFAVSERFKEDMVSLGFPADKIYTIYNGIEFAKPLERDGSLQKELGLAEDDFVMTMVARLHPVKGHENVLRAMKKDNNPKMHLVLVGDGPIKEEIVKTADILSLKDNVHFLGFRDDINRIYSNSHIGLLASFSESFPLALLEAANEKLPLISTDVGGVRLLLSSEEYGWVVPVGEVDQYAEAMNEAYDAFQAGTLSVMGERLYEHASQNFSVGALAAEIEKVYKELIR